MMTLSKQDIIQQTQHWINEVVVGLNLCPFAASTIQQDSIEYIVAQEINNGSSIEQHLQQVADCLNHLDKTASTETSLIIYQKGYENFDNYLDLYYLATQLVEDLNYSGVYQIASFHPEYRFEGSMENDAANFSNRSPYPMLHILREQSIEKAIENFPDIDSVPENNIKNLQQIGYDEMQRKLKKSLTRKAT